MSGVVGMGRRGKRDEEEIMNNIGINSDRVHDRRVVEQGE
jgi:hypothetical protein